MHSLLQGHVPTCGVDPPMYPPWPFKEVKGGGPNNPFYFFTFCEVLHDLLKLFGGQIMKKNTP